MNEKNTDRLIYFRACHALFDIILCREFLENIVWDNPLCYERNQAFEIAFVIVYGRNFVGGNEKDREIPSSLPDHVLSELTNEERELHNTIVKKWRNKLIAHTELGFILPSISIEEAPGELRSTEHHRSHILRLISKEDICMIHIILRKIESSCIWIRREFEKRASAGKYTVYEA